MLFHAHSLHCPSWKPWSTPGQTLCRSNPHRLEDLEVALDAAARVNRHLNTEAQALVSELRRARRERDAWQRHAQHLARCLAAERRRRAGERRAPGRGGAAGGLK